MPDTIPPLRRATIAVCVAVALSNSAITAQIAPPKPEAVTRIAWLGCHKQFEPAPALARYLELDADYALWIGDNVYADTTNDPGFIRRCYAALAAKPAFPALRASLPFLVTWDDHDFGLNNAGGEYALKAASKELFREFWNVAERIPADRDGIYDAHLLETHGHRLQVILLDPRYNREAPGPASDTLGERQWSWLAEQLRVPADLRLVVSGYQVLLDAGTGSETWAEFPAARERLFRTIREAGAQRVVFLTGDQHYGEVCRLRDALDFDAVELQFAGINQNEKPEKNTSRVSEVALAKHKVCWLDIHWRDGRYDVPFLDFAVANAMDETIQVRYRLRFDELETRVELPPGREFVDSHTLRFDLAFSDLVLRVTTDGTPVTVESEIAPPSAVLRDTTTVRARLFTPSGHARGPEGSATYTRVEPRPAGAFDPVDATGLRWIYGEGDFARLPDFESVTILAEGSATDLDVAKIAKREDHWAVSFTGLFRAERDGVYTFHVRSDDGSRLWIADQQVVDNDGSHSPRTRSGTIALAKGWHTLRLDHFDDTDGSELSVSFAIDDGPARRLDPQRDCAPR